MCTTLRATCDMINLKLFYYKNPLQTAIKQPAGDISISGTLELVRMIFSSVGFTLLTVNFICHWMWVCIFKLLENFPNPRMLSACLLCLQRSGKSSAESVLELKKIQKEDASSTPVEKCNEGCQRHWLFTYSICQNPDVMSNLWNTAVPSSCARVSSTTGSTCGFLCCYWML